MAVMLFLLFIQLHLAGLYSSLMIPPLYLGHLWFAWLTLFAWYLHSIRVKWKSPPRILIYSGLFLLALLMFENLYFFFNFELIISNGAYTNLAQFDGFVLEITRAIIGFFLLFAYRKPSQIIETKRINTVIMIWRILGATILISGIINVISMIYLLILKMPIIPSIFTLLDYSQIITNYIFVILIFYVAIRYPEFLLITEAQILRACKLYLKVQVLDQPLVPEKWGLEQIKTYIQSIPASFFEGKCPETETNQF